MKKERNNIMKKVKDFLEKSIIRNSNKKCFSLISKPLNGKEIFTEANEYDIDKIKRKLDMFLQTNDLQYLNKVLYLTKELIKDNM